MQCGHLLDREPPVPPAGAPRSAPAFASLGLSLLASLALSLVLIFVFRLPVFLLFGFLPLFWWRRER